MIDRRIITENQLDEWVHGNAREAQGLIVDLIFRLVAVSTPKPKERRFPLSDSIGQPGPDGTLITDLPFEPFVPEGRSFWEIGTGIHAGDKATSDYRDLTTTIPDTVRRESTFIFVTPLSGRRDWQHTWKEEAQSTWLEDRRKKNEWKDIRVIDGTKLIDWLSQFPAVEQWLAVKMAIPAHQIQTPEQRWDILKDIGAPPQLNTKLFLMNRTKACEKLKDVFSGQMPQLKLDTRFPDQVADFVAAYIASMDKDVKDEVIGRCLIISGNDAWGTITAIRERHILVADFDLSESDPSGTRLLEKAHRSGHSVIFGGMPGGTPGPDRVPIPNPKCYQIEEALKEMGYKEERARVIAQKSDGNLSSLLKNLQNLPLMPKWAQVSDATDLAIAELLGGWNEQSDADKIIVEKLAAKPYGQWIGKIREVALHSDTPLVQHNGIWKVTGRHEGWYALGPRIFNEHLDRFKEIVVSVLHEKDPKFELPPDKQYAAAIYDKVLSHSHFLRNGLANSLALLGSHPKALTSCSNGKAEITANLIVREILANADWVRWASLSDLLSLLAEAAPQEFLSAVEIALNSNPCPFGQVFAQEGTGITGSNYMTGLLWALETLAWDAKYLTRIVLILGELSTKDPGGKWANRPDNSFATILSPWLPQTCTPVAKRQTAVATLMKEHPDAGWKLLLTLLPRSHQVSVGSHKPVWMEIIPDDWTSSITNIEYYEQALAYSKLAIEAAKSDPSKLVAIIERLDDLPPPARSQLLSYTGSDTIVALPQADRLRLWTELIDIVSKHRKFADAEWAMAPEIVNEIASVAEKIVPNDPFYLHRRLFIERDSDLYEEKGNYEEQRNKLESRRQKAVSDIFSDGGIKVVLEFAKVVESPRHLGAAFGEITSDDVDKTVIPALLESEAQSLRMFISMYIWAKYRVRGWKWVDGIDTSQWSRSKKGQFFAYLPFTSDAWERVAKLLGNDQSLYWSKTDAFPYDTKVGLELAIDRLIEHARPFAAIRCIQKLLYDKQPLNNAQAVRVLKASLNSNEGTNSMDGDTIVDVIQALQNDTNTNPDDLFQIEWAFLQLLNRHNSASPKLIEQKLANEPAFYCEIIQTLFRSKKEDQATEKKEPIKQQEYIVTNASHLLSEWKIPPGKQKDGTYSGDALNTWLKEVKTICAESGHLEAALIKVGHVLLYAPPDPDGFWLHHSAAEVLDAKDADLMRHGFRTELFNSRGVFWGSADKEERKLSEKYRKQAEVTEARNYNRLAETLRGLSVSYERDAERESMRDSIEE